MVVFHGDYVETGSMGGADSVNGVLKDGAVRRVGAQTAGGLQEDIGAVLAGADLYTAEEERTYRSDAAGSQDG